MAGTSALIDRLLEAWHFFWNSVVRVLWLCAYDTVAAVGVAFLFVVNAQGQDLLRISAERGFFSLWNIFFVAGAIALGLALWYSARLLLGREFSSYPLDLDATRWGREWLPRLLGGSVPFSVAVGFFFVDTSQRLNTLALGVVFLLIAVGLVWFFIRRRQWFMKSSRAMLDSRVVRLDSRSRLVAVCAVSLSFVLLASFMIWPVWMPQTLGAPAIVVLGFAGISLFGSMVLTYAFLAKGQPSGTALFLVLAIVFAYFNDNHWVRLTDDAISIERPSPAKRYTEWRDSHQAAPLIDGREPVILVAASGGGIRAAYWTASTLAALERIEGFGDNLFAISGVSGGSLGAATYTALKHQQLATAQTADTLQRVREVLGEDFLSPVVAGFLFPDLIQRFIPIPVSWADRQRFLEKSWEDALGSRPNPFSEAFTTLYGQEHQASLPSLLLNATVVDSGRRAVVSNIDVSKFTDTVDLLGDDYSTQRARLSAAAGMSARFTYVSPAGTLDGPEGKIRVVDGGYFENSGAATAMDLLTNLDVDGNKLFPILVLIRNDPQAPSVCNRSGAESRPQAEDSATSDFLTEISSPIRALLNARTARGRLAEVDAARVVETQYNGAVIEVSLAAVMQSRLATAMDEKQKKRIRARMIEPPLGWSLSTDVRAAMDEVIDTGSGGLDKELRILDIALGNASGDYIKCNAR